MNLVNPFMENRYTNSKKENRIQSYQCLAIAYPTIAAVLATEFISEYE